MFYAGRVGNHRLLVTDRLLTIEYVGTETTLPLSALGGARLYSYRSGAGVIWGLLCVTAGLTVELLPRRSLYHVIFGGASWPVIIIGVTLLLLSGRSGLEVRDMGARHWYRIPQGYFGGRAAEEAYRALRRALTASQSAGADASDLPPGRSRPPS